jgi:hypothetical protein
MARVLILIRVLPLCRDGSVFLTNLVALRYHFQ